MVFGVFLFFLVGFEFYSQTPVLKTWTVLSKKVSLNPCHAE